MEYRTEKEKKFGSIYQSHADEIYRVCLHLTKDKELAGDVMQQAFFSLYLIMEEVPRELMFKYLVCKVRDLVNNRK